jgi:hypothetical protein
VWESSSEVYKLVTPVCVASCVAMIACRIDLAIHVCTRGLQEPFQAALSSWWALRGWKRGRLPMSASMAATAVQCSLPGHEGAAFAWMEALDLDMSVLQQGLAGAPVQCRLRVCGR